MEGKRSRPLKLLLFGSAACIVAGALVAHAFPQYVVHPATNFFAAVHDGFASARLPTPIRSPEETDSADTYGSSLAQSSDTPVAATTAPPTSQRPTLGAVAGTSTVIATETNSATVRAVRSRLAALETAFSALAPSITALTLDALILAQMQESIADLEDRTNTRRIRQSEEDREGASDHVSSLQSDLETSVSTGALTVSGTFTDGASSAGTDGYLLQTTGTSTRWVATTSLGISGGSGGITSLNGLASSTQTFATSTSGGLDLAITSSGSTHTFTAGLTSGYTIPLAASTTEWATAYGWGDHSTAGYLAASNNLSDLTSSSTARTNLGLGTLATQNSVDISDNTNLSVSATGLELSADAIALSAGYTIPLSASTTEWATAYGWGDHSTQGYLTGITGESLESLSDVAAMTQSSGDLLYWTGSNWSNIATSSLGISSGSSLWTESGSDIYYTSGLVGIGDTSPDHTLDVTGNIGIDSLGYINWGDVTGSSGYGLRDNGGVVQFKNSGGNWSALDSSSSGASTTASGIGMVSSFPTATCPAGWLQADGSAVSRSTYADLFSEIGTTYGSGDGSTTFNLPDLRGEFIRGWDDGRGVDSGRSIGSTQSDEFKSHYHHSGLPHIDTNGQFGSDGGFPSLREAGWGNAGSDTTSLRTSTEGGSETRPRNLALNYCISYRGSVSTGILTATGDDAYFTSGNLALGTTTVNRARLTVQATGTDPVLDLVEADGASIFRVLESGNIGIGTTTPNSKLTVAGDLYVTGAFRDSTNASGTNGMILQTTGIGTQWVATSTLGIESNPFDQTLNTTDDVTFNTINVTSGTSTFAGNIEMTGDIIPSTDVTYNLGSPSKQWQDVYIGPGSLYINGQKVLQEDSDTIVVSADLDQNLNMQTSGIGSVTMRAQGTGNALLSATSTGGVTLSSASGNISINSTSGNINLGTTGSGQLNLGTITSGTWNGIAIDVSDYTNLAVSAAGLELSADAIALSAGYTIPLTASTTEWATAYGWGDHSTQGYLTGITGESLEDLSDVAAMAQSSGDLLYWTGSNWSNIATSSLGISGGSSLWSEGGSDIYYTSGNVGIGTSTPTSMLHVSRSGTQLIKLDRSGNTTRHIDIASDDSLRISRTGVADDITIDSSGNVGIGTTDPQASLDTDVIHVGRSAGSAIEYFEMSVNDRRALFHSIQDEFTGTGGGFQFDIGGADGLDDSFIISQQSDLSAVGPTNVLFSVQAGGNVGIGTTTPTTILDIQGSTVNKSRINVLRTGGSGVAAQLLSTGNVAGLAATNNGPLSFYTADTERVRVDSSGNVGIGDTSPDGTLKLDVEGSIGAATLCDENGANCAAVTSLTSGSSPWSQSGSDIYYTSGNVGIGTSSPQQALHIWKSSGHNYLKIETDAASQAAVEFLKGGAQKWVTYVNSNSDDLQFYDGTSNRVTFQDGGNVGIGTTSPADLLSLAGTGNMGLRISSDDGSGNYSAIRLHDATGEIGVMYTNNFDDSLNFGVGGGNPEMTIASTSNVGIGTASPNTKLHITGDGTDQVLTIDSQANDFGVIRFNEAGTGRWDMGLSNDEKFYLYDVDQSQFRMTVDGSGNVGIGTTSPATKLEVNGTARASRYDLGSLSNAYIDDNIGTGNPGINFDATDYLDYDRSTNLMRFSAGGNIGMVLDSSGNIGIGTTTPSKKLHIQSSSGSSDAMTVLDQVGTNGWVGHMLQRDGSEKWFIGMNDTNVLRFRRDSSSDDMVIDTTGNVGIGTTNPQQKLTVTNGDSAVVNVYSNGGSVGVIDTVDPNVSSTGRWLSINPTGGNVGIGTASPAEELDVAGSILIRAASAVDNNSSGLVAVSGDDFLYDGKYINHYGFGFHDFNDGGGNGNNAYVSGYYGVDFFTGGQNRIRVSSTGNVGIGTTNPNNGKVEVKGGTVCVDTNSDDNASSCIASESDERLKDNITTIPDALDILRELRGVSFDWRTSDEEVLEHYPLIGRFQNRPESYGLIAQEVMGVIPEAVSLETVGDDEVQYYQLEYDKFIPFLIEGVKELDARTAYFNGLEAAVTNASSSDLFADEGATFWQRLAELAAAFKDGVLKLASAEIEYVKADKLCLGEACITESELTDLLEMREEYAAQAYGAGSGDEDPVTDDSGADDSASTEDPDGSTDSGAGDDTNTNGGDGGIGSDEEPIADGGEKEDTEGDPNEQDQENEEEETPPEPTDPATDPDAGEGDEEVIDDEPADSVDEGAGEEDADAEEKGDEEQEPEEESNDPPPSDPEAPTGDASDDGDGEGGSESGTDGS